MTVRRLPRGLSIVVILAVCVTFALISGPLPTIVAIGIAGIAAAGACFVRARRRTGRLRLTWAVLGAGVLVAGLDPIHGYFVLAAAAVLSWFTLPLDRGTTTHVFRSIVDALLVGVSLTMLSWNFVMGPLLATGGASDLPHPIADVFLATGALIMLTRMRGVPDAGPFAMICSALLTFATAGSVAVHFVIAGPLSWVSAGTAGWLAGMVMVLLAAVSPGSPGKAGSDERRPFEVLLPYTVVITALLVGLVFLAVGGQATTVGTWCRSILILLIVARQVLILRENRQLAVRLEARVAERTSELLAREQRFRALVEQSSESLAILEADSTVRYQSESVERVFGFPQSVLAGRRLLDVAGKASPRIAQGIEEALRTPWGTNVFELPLRHGDGVYRLAEMTITNLMDDPYVHGLVFNTRDVSEARELQDRLRHDAYHDGLTGLVNRTLFREHLEAAAGGDRLAVLFLDLDGFKEVNDSLGHAAGDQLLVQFAGRLRAAVPAGCTVARLGGDEFAVIVEGQDARDLAETLAQEILDGFATPFAVEGRELHVGAGIGIASAVDAGGIEQLQRNADLAMYKAKDAGGGGYATYHPGMHDALVQRIELAADLRHALDRDELVLHYQPTVDLRTGEITGFEALVRWKHPVRGMVPPLDFIGVAESTGLIVPLGRWVLAEACRQAVAWGRPLRMAVNVSVRQFDDGDLARTVAEVLAETGMRPDRLCLEMTESVLLTDTDENLNRIVALKALGVMLAMDDFGTGYSSLAYPQRFPMDILKIDRSFVDRLSTGSSSEDAALVQTIVRLGQRFGMSTVAEGIEDAVQLAALGDMGCNVGQGYLFSRPLPAPEATGLLETGVPFPVPIA